MNCHRIFPIVLFIILQTLSCSRSDSSTLYLLNASYDPTREFFSEYNAFFSKRWEEQHHQRIIVRQSHGGSGKQARSVIDGLPADVLTLALAFDIDAAAKNAIVATNWRSKFPENSAPFTSTIVFVVRKGNHKNITDWPDLTHDNISIVTPNPKTSGGARWCYLAAWGYAKKKLQLDDSHTAEFVHNLYRNVAVFDSGARGATTSFAQNDIGDVLITWENEAHLVLREFGADRYQIITPSMSILAEPPVAVVDRNVDMNHTRAIAEAYLRGLYSEEAQELAARNFYRPRSRAVMNQYKAVFAPLELFTIDEIFGGWKQAHEMHFRDGGMFDQIGVAKK